MAHDWTKFSVRINVKASVEALYIAWATRAGMENWFLRLSEYKRPGGKLLEDHETIQKGDTYKWLWHGYGDETAEYGEILEANDKDMLKFRFGKAGDCTVTIKNEAGANIVELVQDNIPDDETGRTNWHLGCKTGWTFYLANLKSVFEGGIDLRNKDARIQHVINS